MSSEIFSLKPIGYFYCSQKRTYEVASQAHLSRSSELGYIEIRNELNPNQILSGLQDMTHLWVIFWFHQKSDWQPMVMPPRGPREKKGVFATRSPHRPNPIGLTLVEIQDIRQNKIYIQNYDLIDETPIMDLKPFHPEADKPSAHARYGWLEGLSDEIYAIEWDQIAIEQIQFLEKNQLLQLKSFCEQQLSFNPTDSSRKRVKRKGSSDSCSEWTLAYKTWRIEFSLKKQSREIRVHSISSAYTQNDFDSKEDPHSDKLLHVKFNNYFKLR